jgi:hypothetical protein|tara:strand:- start:455 stop:832 length:378 start_codon:yes stop_codon:yes gene_type:complete
MYEYKNTYCNGDGKYEGYNAELKRLIPPKGAVEDPKNNPKLERYRKMANAYGDISRNGGQNRNKEVSYFFPKVLTLLWEVKGEPRRRDLFDRYNAAFAIIEPIMDKAILFAAVEQDLVVDKTKQK